MSGLNFKDLTVTNLTIREMSNFFNIPYKTVYSWNTGHRTPPGYVVELMLYKWEHRLFTYYIDQLNYKGLENFAYFKAKLGKNLKFFSEFYNIPYKTIQCWNTGHRTPPEYVIELMLYKYYCECL